MRGKPRIAIIAGVLVLVGALVLGIGANPRYLEELRIGGGYGETVDGGADLEKNGDIHTDGDVTAASFNGVDPSHLEQIYIEDSDEGQEFPGTDHTADQATTIEEELDAARHMLSDISGETHWYDEIPMSLKATEDSISNAVTGHNHDGVNSRGISLIPGNLSIEGDVELGDADTDKIAFHGAVADLGNMTPSRLFRYASPQNLIAGGNFEAWPDGSSTNPSYWSAIGGGAIGKESSIVKLGAASAKYTGKTDGTVWLNCLSEPSLSDARSHTFTLAAWIYTSNPSKTRMTTQTDGSTYNSRYAAETNAWHPVTMTFTVPADSTAFECFFAVEANDPPVVAYFDGTSLVEGPEEWSFSEKAIAEQGDQTIYGATTTLEEHVDGAGHDLVVRGQITAGTSDVTITNSSGYVTSGGIADVLRTINIPIPAWSNPDDSVAIGLVASDTDGDDPVYFGTYLYFADEGANNDRASTTIVIPDDYVDGSGEEASLVVYAVPQSSVSNLRLECDVLVQTAGSSLSTTTYTPPPATFSSVGVVKKCEFDIDAVAPVGPGKVLVIRIRRGESGACTGTVLVVGTALQYKASQ